MRLSKSEIEVIKSVVAKFDSSAKIHLFGSRTNDVKKGGDIDLLIFSKKIRFGENLKIKTELKKLLGDQKIDIIFTKDRSNPFVDMVFDESLKIN